MTTLGRDTVALENFRRTSRRLEGEIVLRIPTTVSFRYQVDLDASGRVTRSVTEQRPHGHDDALRRKVGMEFFGDSVRVTIDSLSERAVITRAVKPGTVPILMTGFGNSYGLYTSIGMFGLLLERLDGAAGDSVEVPAISAMSGRPGTKLVVRRSGERIDVDYFRIAWTHVRVDQDRRIHAVDAMETTEQTQAVRARPLDVRAAIKEFATRDAAGNALGVASPADSVRASLDGIDVRIDYSSPRLRGRHVLGVVVPYGVVWRTGANAATVLSVSGDVTVGGVPVSAGSYSVWTMPAQDGVVLILNSQHGQWGTQHDASKDRYRIPMQVTVGAGPREKFTIALSGAGSERLLRIEWDDFVWSVPISRRR